MTSGSCIPVTFKEILKKSHLITCFKTVFLIYDKQMWMSTMQCLFQIKTKNKFITWFTYFIFNSIHLCILSKLVRVWIAGKIIFIVIHMSPSYICVVWNHKKNPSRNLSIIVHFISEWRRWSGSRKFLSSSWFYSRAPPPSKISQPEKWHRHVRIRTEL